MDAYRAMEAALQTLGDSSRLRIIRLVEKKECSVSEIVTGTSLSQPLVSHHLRVLREQGFLEAKRQGPFIFYKLTDPRLLDLLGLLNEIIAKTNTNKRESFRPLFCCPPGWKFPR